MLKNVKPKDIPKWARKYPSYIDFIVDSKRTLAEILTTPLKVELDYSNIAKKVLNDK